MTHLRHVGYAEFRLDMQRQSNYDLELKESLERL